MLSLLAPAAASGIELDPDGLLSGVLGLDASVVWIDTTGDNTVLCTTYNPDPYSAGFEIRNLQNGEVERLSFDWDPAAHGWPGYYLGVPFLAKLSPDGRTIAVQHQLTTADPTESVIIDWTGQPSIVLSWNLDEGEITPLGVLRGADVARTMFTTDGHYLIADSVLDCDPDLASYQTCLDLIREQPYGESGWSRDYHGEVAWYRDVEVEGLPGLYYDTVTGAREIRKLPVDAPAKYIKCPYSDYVLLKKGWPSHHHQRSAGVKFGDLCSNELAGSFRYYGYPEYDWVNWVKSDAVLLKRDSDCTLGYVDGSSDPVANLDWKIYWWFMDDSYLFSTDGGETCRYGLINWDCYMPDVSRELPLPAHFLDEFIMVEYVPQVGLIIKGKAGEYEGRYLKLSVGPGLLLDSMLAVE